MTNRTNKRILLFIDWFLPGTKSGGPVRSCANLIEHLNEGFEFVIVTRNTDYTCKTPYPNISPNSWVKHSDNTKVYYLSEEVISAAKISQLITNTDFDVAYINGMYSWYFSVLPAWFLRKTDKRVIIAARGMLNPQAFAVKGFKKRVFLLVSKVLRLYKNKVFHATNSIESSHIKKKIGNNTTVFVAPNLPRKLNHEPVLKGRFNGVKTFVNVARIAKEKGTLVLLEALKEIKESLVLDIFGPIYDRSYWDECVRVMDNLPANVKVNYKGSLDSEIVPKTISKYDYFVMLSEGENYGHSIVEAFTVGCPVLISDKTPWKNLKSKKIGWDLRLDDRAGIVNALSSAILMDLEEYKQWSANARKFGKEILENEEVLDQNKALFLTEINY